MQNAGQFGQGAASVHPPSQFVSSEPSPNGGSTTSSLRQFRKKDVEKNHVEPQQLQQHSSKPMSESHVARVAPHNHYPPNDGYRYLGAQFSGYAPQMKYSDPAETSQPNPMSTSVIQKPKAKDYMEMCNVQQPHLNNQQYSPEGVQYAKEAYQYKMALHKEPAQGFSNMFKSESQYYQKEQHQYQQVGHHGNPMINQQNMRKFNPAPTDNPFLNKLSKIHPSMARSIISDHHLQDPQPAYPTMDQRTMYAQQNHRFYTGGMHQPNPYSSSPNYSVNPSHPPYANYPPGGCNFPRGPQMAPRYPPHMERSASPTRARGYPNGMHVPSMNYHAIQQKLGPTYAAQYREPEYAQHYQHRRMPQECFPQPCRPAQFMPGHHQMTSQEVHELAENNGSPSDSLKKFIETWAEEDQAGEMSGPMEAGINLRDKLRDDAPPGTVFMINANDVQYFENNGIPIVTSDSSSFQLSSENYQYLNGATVRIIESNNNNNNNNNKEVVVDANGNQERVVNLQIVESPPKDKIPKDDRGKVVIHQNTVLNSSPLAPTLNQLVDSISTKELVDKNCSPINMDQLEENLGFHKDTQPQDDASSLEDLSQNSDSTKSMPLIDFFGEDAHFGESKGVLEDAEAPKTNSSSVIVSRESVKVEPTCVDSDVDEKSGKVGDEGGGGEEKPPVERRKRIFSVDDIMRDRPKREPQESCGTVKEFIEQEMEFSSSEQLSCAAKPRPEILTVPGSTALLQVAGELMEITVKVVDGKKVINVKALNGPTTVVDCNHNYCPPNEKDDQEGNGNFVSSEYEEGSEEGIATENVPEEVAQSEEIVNSPEPPEGLLEEAADICSSVSQNSEAEDSTVSGSTALEPQVMQEVAVTVAVEEEIEIVAAQEIADIQQEGIEDGPPVLQDVQDGPDPDDIKETLTELEQVLLEEEPLEEQSLGEPLEEEPVQERPVEQLLSEVPAEGQLSEEAPEDPPSAEGAQEAPSPDLTVEVVDRTQLEYDVLVDYPLEDEVFIADPPAHEVIVADPLEGVGLTDLISDSPGVPLEQVAAAEVPSPQPEEEEQTRQKLEVQILSPTSTNVEDNSNKSTDKDSSSAAVATKAAKKLYEPDLQVQHATVSSSKKEERPPKIRKKPKRVGEKLPADEEPQLKKLKVAETCQDKDQKAADNPPPPEEDEYVDFKELLRARKLKKLRKQQEMEAKQQTPEEVTKGDQKSEESVKQVAKKRVSFSDECPSSTVPMHPKDPRRRSRVYANQVLVPSVCELMEENNSGSASKKKISLADYVNRKRKACDTDVAGFRCSKIKASEIPAAKPPFLIHSSDWEDSNSPSPPKDQCLIDDFSGLIKTNPPKLPVVDVNELVPPSESHRNISLQEYKERVDLQLNSLSIQIPKKPPQPPNRPPCNSDLVKRFLNNGKLSKSEMEDIRKIIDYKKSMQQKNAKHPEPDEAQKAEEGSNSCGGYSVINRLGDDGQPKIIFKRNKAAGAVKQPVVELVKLDLADLEKVKEKYNVTVRQTV